MSYERSDDDDKVETVLDHNLNSNSYYYVDNDQEIEMTPKVTFNPKVVGGG